MANTRINKKVNTIPIPSSMRLTPIINKSVVGIAELDPKLVQAHFYVGSAPLVKQRFKSKGGISTCFVWKNALLFRIYIISIVYFNTIIPYPHLLIVLYAAGFLNNRPPFEY